MTGLFQLRASNRKNSQPVALVTGAAGFIGSNLCRALLANGHKVYGVDNLITGRQVNIDFLEQNKDFYFYQQDIVSGQFYDTFEKIKLDHIFHLACPTGVPNISRLAEEMLLTCSVGTRHVLEIARKNKARTLFTSTAEIYGQPEIFPQHENYNGNVDPIGPRSPYEEGKRFSESLMAMYVRKYKLKGSIVRIFNTYGPGMSLDDQRVIPCIISKIRNDEEIIIYGDGKQTRTHLYVQDLLKGLFLVTLKGKFGEAYNVGGSRPVAIIDLAHLIMKILNRQNNIKFTPHFVEDHRGRRPSVAKVRALGWRQTIPLPTGIRRLAAFHGLTK